MNQKKVLVTGASSGIGEALARKLASENYAVTLVSRRKKILEEIQKQLPGTDHKILVADLSTNAGVTIVEKELHKNHYTVCINNAGIGVFGEFEKTQLDRYDKLTSLNITALMHISHAFLNHAISGDSLINVASMVAFTSYPKSPVYAGSKSFVLTFTKSLAYEQSKRGIYVCALCPGITKTNWSTNAGGDPHQKYPPLITRSTKDVALDCWEALEARSTSVIPCGLINIASYYAFKFFPSSLLTWMMGEVIGKSTKVATSPVPTVAKTS